MASPQKENGYTPVANEILEQIARIKLNGTQWSIVMVVWRNTYGFNRKSHKMSHSYIANAIGIQRKHVSREIKVLFGKNILQDEGKKNTSNYITFNKNYDTWVAPTAPESVAPTAPESVAPTAKTAPQLGAQERNKIKDKKKTELKTTLKKAAGEEIIAYLNRVCGTRYRATNKATAEHINARLDEKYTVDDFKTVIDKKFMEWGDDPYWCKFLRPTTLFCPKHFDDYLNQPWTNGKKFSETDKALMRFVGSEINTSNINAKEGTVIDHDTD